MERPGDVLDRGIDDATSDVPYAAFSETETLESYMRVLRRIVERKGRVERLWATLQDRLVSEFRLHGIQTTEQANGYLNQVFIPETWSKKFLVPAHKAGDLYRPRSMDQDLDQIFCLKLERKIRKDHTILFGNEIYGVTAELGHSVARKMAEIRIYGDGSLRGYYGGKDLELRLERKQAWERHEDRKTRPGACRVEPCAWKRFPIEHGQLT